MLAGESETGVPNPQGMHQCIQWPGMNQVQGEPGKLLLSYCLSSASCHPSLDGGKIAFHGTCPWSQKDWGPLI